ncbi:MAG: hypothetical protein AAFR22_24175, partial [Chloroflexota bacterium]
MAQKPDNRTPLERLMRMGWDAAPHILNRIARILGHPLQCEWIIAAGSIQGIPAHTHQALQRGTVIRFLCHRVGL